MNAWRVAALFLLVGATTCDAGQVVEPVPPQSQQATQAAASANPLVPFSERPLLSPNAVVSRCMARLGSPTSGNPTPHDGSLTPLQWSQFANCSIASNIRFKHGSLMGSPDAVVRISLGADGSVQSVALDQPSGNLIWDGAIQQSIQMMPKLPPAPASLDGRSITLRFRVGMPIAAADGSSVGPSLHGAGHWVERDCLSVGGTQACH